MQLRLRKIRVSVAVIPLHEGWKANNLNFSLPLKNINWDEFSRVTICATFTKKKIKFVATTDFQRFYDWRHFYLLHFCLVLRLPSISHPKREENFAQSRILLCSRLENNQMNRIVNWNKRKIPHAQPTVIQWPFREKHFISWTKSEIILMPWQKHCLEHYGTAIRC